MSGWSTATLTRNDVVGPGLHRLELDVATKVAHSFHVPGQYHRVRVAKGLVMEQNGTPGLSIGTGNVVPVVDQIGAIHRQRYASASG